ncbi:MAG: hypothetical protein M3R32_04660 [Chloroflexota bacterium]|nr:hypothetical protein [Chloroflexota bacterium]
MSQHKEATGIEVGDHLLGAGGKRIGRVDAVFADYLLVRSGWILPVDLYVPRDAVASTDRGLQVDLDRSAAYQAWHRPLKRAPHQ